MPQQPLKSKTKPKPASKDSYKIKIRNNAAPSSSFLTSIGDFFLKLLNTTKNLLALLPDILSGLIKEIPVINYFTTGLSMLYQGVEAYQDKTTPQRKTKIAMGMLGGLLSVS